MKPHFLIIGLGNPGKQYEKTRHNIGFQAVDYLAKELGAGDFQEQQKFLCVSSEGVAEGKPVMLVKPTTFMNRSGECIRKLVDFYKLDPAKQVLVMCDDVDIPLGTHRFRANGGPGTHNGLKSIVDIFGENFQRVRIGLGPQPKEIDLSAWVLSVLTVEEEKEIRSVFGILLTSLQEVLVQ